TTATAVGAVLSNYNVSYVAGNFSITQATATVTAGNGTKVYGKPDPALSATTAVGFTAADAPTITLNSTRAAGESVGNYATTATAVGPAVSNYNVSYVAGNFTITPAALTVTAVNATKVYGSPNPAFSVTYSAFANGDTAASLAGLSFTTGATASSTVGSYPVTPGGLVDANYTFTYVNG